MFRRLLSDGNRGMFVPDLAIYHWIPAARLTKRHYRRWAFDRGVSKATLDHRNPEPVTYLLGVPRHLFGTAARCSWDSIRRLLTNQCRPDVIFGNELSPWGPRRFPGWEARPQAGWPQAPMNGQPA